ncbi:phosphoribosylanthranilate isomerase [Methanoculleus sp.]|uniref:phosphoribosylanthranilate isomerase n=2 Tax=unclassified Methanoculleus TaxID=2619537 RepID=UPI0025E80DDD|nr:phosphoribosylanthranilate isomerase [Methanoculleus sp.]MCK9318000.1 phosphoribosylanthranilate isomerase [Methanoculleus sp.]MDD2254096.1 phosphoribosylanthranilate isomerase [Methanoculleus sp.]MDD2786873.1 phosphoribosylanthranilate isomerase [Methanoculleus sp.]MDD3215345.1 phosphoribosylanthranilate isomerase [Methanoculleus sp.]MDD4314330.1 phosphoribosylanthranilate isomerase [Methanoculleus sp.]
MKICGMTSVRDALLAVAAGADAIGVVLASPSPRSVTPEVAREIFAAVPPFVTTVAVTSTTRPEDLPGILALRPDAVQVAGGLAVPRDAGVRVIRMLAPGEPLRDDCDAVIVDNSHGTGRAFDPEYARECVASSPVPVILAGGLAPGNVAAAIRAVRPYAVDVCSGVEAAPGVKDQRLMRAFVKICRMMNDL